MRLNSLNNYYMVRRSWRYSGRRIRGLSIPPICFRYGTPHFILTSLYALRKNSRLGNINGKSRCACDDIKRVSYRKST